MSASPTSDERESFRRLVGRALSAAVRDLATVDDPAELEVEAAGLIPSAVLGTPAGDSVIGEGLALIAEAPGGYAVLRALAAAAPPPVARSAARAAAELEAGGRVLAAAVATQVGTLTLEQAWWIDDGSSVTSLMAVGRRPTVAGAQVLALTFEWSLTGGAVKDGFVTGMLADEELPGFLVDPWAAAGVQPEELSLEDALGLVAGGVRRNADSGLAPSEDAAPAVALLLRAGGTPDAEALLGELTGLPSLCDAFDDVEPEEVDTGRQQAAIDELVAGFEAWYGERESDVALVDLAVYAAGTMADFRAWHANGRVAAWTADDLDEYLLEWVPYRVALEDDSIDGFPAAVAQVLGFLGETGRLPAGRARTLAEAAAGLAQDFGHAARDPGRFGPAKAITAAMLSDGIDPSDRGAVDGWLARFNELPRDERDRRVPALGRPLLPVLEPSAPAAKPKGKTRSKKTRARKAERQARSRSRRRR